MSRQTKGLSRQANNTCVCCDKHEFAAIVAASPMIMFCHKHVFVATKMNLWQIPPMINRACLPVLWQCATTALPSGKRRLHGDKNPGCRPRSDFPPHMLSVLYGVRQAFDGVVREWSGWSFVDSGGCPPALDPEQTSPVVTA